MKKKIIKLLIIISIILLVSISYPLGMHNGDLIYNEYVAKAINGNEVGKNDIRINDLKLKIDNYLRNKEKEGLDIIDNKSFGSKRHFYEGLVGKELGYEGVPFQIEERWFVVEKIGVINKIEIIYRSIIVALSIYAFIVLIEILSMRKSGRDKGD